MKTKLNDKPVNINGTIISRTLNKYLFELTGPTSKVDSALVGFSLTKNIIPVVIKSAIPIATNSLNKSKYFNTLNGVTELCFENQISFNRFLSEICLSYYEHAPKINNELINRKSVSAQIKKARNLIIDAKRVQARRQLFLELLLCIREF